ncbi:hypothetical protein [Sphingomonas sp. MS122]|uniref:hypothetical protein n=1 Tax=Sphingomonas sp. MS122 TaxID=3412683 RepID=UPI003C30D477
MFAILLLLSQGSNIETMSLEQIDAELSATVYSARGGWLFHHLGHLICQDSARLNRIVEVNLRYSRLEREYELLGGTFAPEEEQSIMEEAVHRTCEAGDEAKTARAWRARSDETEQALARMQSLLARKRAIANNAPAPR